MNDFNSKNGNKVKDSLIYVGQQKDRENRILPDPYYERTLPMFPKFERTPQSEGYITGSYKHGLLQLDAFFLATGARESLVKKGQMTAVGGYLARRLN